MRRDPSVWTAGAWNDNGIGNRVQVAGLSTVIILDFHCALLTVSGPRGCLSLRLFWRSWLDHDQNPLGGTKAEVASNTLGRMDAFS